MIETPEEKLLLGLNNMGGLYVLDEQYHGTIQGNGEYIKSEEFFIETKRLLNQNVIKIVNSYNFIIAITDQGKVYSWGDNSYGQLGNGAFYNVASPICISNIEGNKLNGKIIKKIDINIYSTMAVDQQNNIYIYGETGNQSQYA